MFVCICNAIREREVAAVAADAACVADVFKGCGHRPQCGKCFSEMARVMSETKANDGDSALVATAAE